MFESKTAIILGAGASYLYGYPLAYQLLDEITDAGRKSLKQIAENEINFRSHSLEDISRKKLHNAIMTYNPTSIDSFLSHYADDDELILNAKKLIAEIILTHGDLSYFNKDNQRIINNDVILKTNWYRFLWDAMVSDIQTKELADSDMPLNFDIISFNYDLSLEYFLNSRVTDENSMFSEEQQPKILNKLKSCIHHVYGCVNTFTWKIGDTLNSKLIYNPRDSDFKKTVESAIDKILLINDRKQIDCLTIQNIIKGADQVIFLGFAFDDTNIGKKVLNLEETLKPRWINNRRFPVIKYTNYGDKNIINAKINYILDNHTQHLMEDGNVLTLDPRDDRVKQRTLIKSPFSIYEALENDFTLNRV